MQMKWSLLDRCWMRGLSECILFSACWQNDIPHYENASCVWFSSPPPYTSQTNDSWQWKIFFSIQSPVHLPSTDIVAPTGMLSCLDCFLCSEKTGVVDLGELKHINILSWLCLWKEEYLYAPHVDIDKYSSPLTILLLSCNLSNSHYWSSIYAAADLPLVAYMQPCSTTSILPCAIHKK